MDKQQEYEEKIPQTLGEFPDYEEKEGIRRVFFRGGFCSVSVKISCLALLSEETQVLAVTPDPCEAACIAARCSHAIGGREGEHASRLD